MFKKRAEVDNVTAFISNLSDDQQLKLREFFVRAEHPELSDARILGDATCDDIDDESRKKLIAKVKNIVGPREVIY